MSILAKTALPLAAALALAGCQSGGGGPLLAARGSAAGVPITFESIEGAPPALHSALTGELASAASARQVEVVGAEGQARYRLRGYLTTEQTADGGTALAFVWDVFDAERRRAQRITGSSPVRTASRRPRNAWEELDKEALARLAARSMDEIASFLNASAGGAPPLAFAPSPPPAEPPDAS
jgi:hypothetical protein